MTDLSKLTNDEQIILLNTISVEILMNMAAKLVDKNIEEVKQDVANANAAFVGLMSDKQAKEYIEKHRRHHANARKAFEEDLNE